MKVRIGYWGFKAISLTLCLHRPLQQSCLWGYDPPGWLDPTHSLWLGSFAVTTVIALSYRCALSLAHF